MSLILLSLYAELEAGAGRQKMTEQMQLLAGMPAEVMIRTGDRTFASYITKPITDMLARAIREE